MALAVWRNQTEPVPNAAPGIPGGPTCRRERSIKEANPGPPQGFGGLGGPMRHVLRIAVAGYGIVIGNKGRGASFLAGGLRMQIGTVDKH